ncbi:MAG TPA: hypothetical protein VGG36_09275 [Rhizomicrobium sp.]|jgi:hypothetical protein
MRNWWYLLLGPPAAMYLALIFSPQSILVKTAPYANGKLACTYFTGTRTETVREAHFCDHLHVLVRTDRVIR